MNFVVGEVFLVVEEYLINRLLFVSVVFEVFEVGDFLVFDIVLFEYDDIVEGWDDVGNEMYVG